MALKLSCSFWPNHDPTLLLTMLEWASDEEADRSSGSSWTSVGEDKRRAKYLASRPARKSWDRVHSLMGPPFICGVSCASQTALTRTMVVAGLVPLQHYLRMLTGHNG